MTIQTNEGMTRIDARIPVDLKESLAVAASLEGRSMTDFLIAALAEATRKTITQHSIIQVCLDDQKALASALINDNAAPLPRLQQAVAEHAKATGK
ncbi:DUF1778 domain-containing protein [Desulfovibrio cuneatus]|uniref:type II toxin-antitoxin system TacA family antitoxin n=1 Tax=Desulfovibrio cuneatus TaxID=159728 RepID=UPI0004107B94|nr:DUF1778 domain-containing protein [Desulfovibrio cuneatus]